MHQTCKKEMSLVAQNGNQIILICGQFRSGSTYLANNINQFNDANIHQETSFLRYSKILKLTSYLPFGLGRFLVYKLILHILTVNGWKVEKTLHNIIREQTRSTNCIHTLYLNIFASLYGKNWGDNTPVYLFNLNKLSKIAALKNVQLKALITSRKISDIVLSAEKATHFVQSRSLLILEVLKRHKKIVELVRDHRIQLITYEELTTHPNKVVQKLTNLNLTSDFESTRIHSSFTNTQSLGHHKNISKKLFNTSRNKRKNLSRQDCLKLQSQIIFYKNLTKYIPALALQLVIMPFSKLRRSLHKIK